MPRALSTGEVAGIVDEYRNATHNALDAGFDGVELHAASGYLPEQFLSSSTNHRTDRYGGTLVNRARFILEVVAGMASAGGSGRVGIKISPEMNFNDIRDATPADTYRYLVKQLDLLNLAYLHVARSKSELDYPALLKPLFHGHYLHGGGLTRETALALVERGQADGVVFGSLLLANPDLVQRFSWMHHSIHRTATRFIRRVQPDTSTTRRWHLPRRAMAGPNCVRFSFRHPFGKARGLVRSCLINACCQYDNARRGRRALARHDPRFALQRRVAELLARDGGLIHRPTFHDREHGHSLVVSAGGFG